MKTATTEELEQLKSAALAGGNNEIAAYFNNRILEQLMLVALRRDTPWSPRP